jgi:hypothetical protein
MNEFAFACAICNSVIALFFVSSARVTGHSELEAKFLPVSSGRPHRPKQVGDGAITSAAVAET